MRALGVSRTSLVPGGVLAGPWVRNELWRRARAVPTLDLRFADNKSLTDAVTGASLVTFNRASSGTYVDSAGVIQTATTNLLLQSEDFSTTWAATRSTVTANATTAPNGTLSADKLTEDSSTNTHPAQQSVTVTSGTAYTASVFAKAGERTFLCIFPTVFGTNAGAWFNLTTGTVGTVQASATASMQTLSNGWFRCTITWTATNTTGTINIAPASANNVVSYTGDGTSGLFLWGAQLEQASTVGEYIPTTSAINSAPRFDHNPVTGESLGLLVEEQRTNLLLRSEEFDNAGWVRSGVTLPTVTANASVAPGGAITADLWTRSITGANFISQAVAKAASAIQYTFSVFVKQSVGNFCALRCQGTFPNKVDVVFNISSGTISTAATVAGGTFTGPSASITAYPNGWYRLTVTATSDTALVYQCFASFSSNGVVIDGTDSVSNSAGLLWGAQLEAGSGPPTSYIKNVDTVGGVTRSADVASITGSAFSSWYRQDEGTVFVSYQFPTGSAVNSSSRTLIDLSNGTTDNRFNVRGIGGATALDQITVRSGASTVAQFSTNGTAVGTALRAIAAVYRLDDYAAVATGSTSAVTDTSGVLPVGINQANIGGAAIGGEYLSGHIRRLTYWNQRLANSTLQNITL